MHTLVITEDKQLYTFGAGEFGECGAGDQKNKLLPTKIDILKPKKKPTGDPAFDLALICQVAAGKKHSMVLSEAGNLFTFGYGDNGQLGHKDTDNQKKPKHVDFGDVRVSAIQAGDFHSVVQTQAGDLYATGLNRDGQLGLGDCRSKTSFTRITCFAGLNVSKFFAGGNHSWFMIDEFLPTVTNYKPPEPLGAPKAVAKGKGAQDRPNPYLSGKTVDHMNNKNLPQLADANQPLENREQQNKILSN